MEFSCLQENLAKGLSIVSRAVATRSTLPVLSNILMATDEGRLKLSATNLGGGHQLLDRGQGEGGRSHHRARTPPHRLC